MRDTQGQYKGPIDCLMQTVKKEGAVALQKGWVPAYIRLGPHTMISFLLIEKIRLFIGLKSIWRAEGVVL